MGKGHFVGEGAREFVGRGRLDRGGGGSAKELKGGVSELGGVM
jgi:hypothetical protein